MPITLDTPTGERSPVLSRKAIGEVFVGMLVKAPEQRPVLKDGKPVLKDDGKPRQELVVTLLALPGTTMAAGLGTGLNRVEAVPAPGDIVRTILKGGGYGAWIEADNALKPRQVGDVVTISSAYGQAYDANGKPSGGRLETQAECDAIPRSMTLGIYGPIDIRRPTPAEQTWVAKAEEAYAATQTPTVLDSGPAADDLA